MPACLTAMVRQRAVAQKAFFLLTAKFWLRAHRTAAITSAPCLGPRRPFAAWQPCRPQALANHPANSATPCAPPNRTSENWSRWRPEKIAAEGEGEVAGDDRHLRFRVGFPAKLYGLTMPSERPGHRHGRTMASLGHRRHYSAFNFPVAVWAWNSALAIVCGDATLWKPSEQTPLCAIATIKSLSAFAARMASIRLCSASPSADVRPSAKECPWTSGCRSSPRPARPAWGATSAKKCSAPGPRAAGIGRQQRHHRGRLGGPGPAARAILFGAVGTAGQRCTSTRRVFVHRSLEKELTKRLISAYRQVPIGNPLEAGHLDGAAHQHRRRRCDATGPAPAAGGRRGNSFGGRALTGEKFPGGRYVEPCLAKAGRISKWCMRKPSRRFFT